MRARPGLLAAALLAAACTSGSRVASAPACSAGWRAEWSADSGLALCLPPEFRRAADRPATWRREQDFLVRDLLTISVDPRAAWERGEIHARWPATLASGPCVYADCVTTDSLVAHTDTIAETVVRVETGLLSGGAVGMRRHPALVAGWEAAGERRVYVSGLAEQAPMLDTLRAALRTLRLAPR